MTLYLSSMEMEHQASLALPAGTSQVLIQNASKYLNTASEVEVRLGDGVEVLSIGNDNEDEEEPTVPLALTAANRAAADSLTRANDELARLEAELKALEEEKAMLLANRLMPSGTQAGWSAELQKGATLLRTRLVAIQLATRQLTRQQETQKNLARRLEARSKPDEQVKPYYITVRAARAGTFPLLLRYGVNRRMTWRPRLEIRADEAGKTVQFISSGQVFNRSGLDWDKVRVVLVNEVRTVDVSKPAMEPWTLDSDGENDHIGEGRVDAFVVKGTAAGRPVEASQGTRYEVPELITMAAGDVQRISLPALTLPSRTEYLALPKLSDKVFLQTKVSGWEGLHLPEEAEVYYRGAYVGDTELQGQAYNDSLELSLGFDDRIVVGRTKLEDFSRNAGNQKRRVRLTYELNVRNLHAEPVRIKIQDQVPVSSEKEIQVKVLETTGAQVEERIGRLTWYLNLAPNASQRLRFSFEVEFPKDKEVNIIKHDIRIRSPKFR
ncbi:mucoidy inhibitor MuiA family protein [Hymenobacter sp. CRA2]|uniref:mucoidy inhibitor MuiA family protein n=1 Tax=Hymenobacter sp. CRA2 TaxID=1955620 RepID=UPI0020C9B050|nr:mucoidy inhibitor MuiA family protein [Hymenobacter sp. CRA2]